jgi:carboxymethylenebutenolidase
MKGEIDAARTGREVTVSGHFVDIAGGRAYIAVPEAGKGPGVLVFPDVSDRDRDFRELGDLYAAEGYVALCPELAALSRGAHDIAAVAAALRARSECTGKVGALGFGLGGNLAYLAAAEGSADCAISYYGFGIDFGLNLVSRIGCPLVLHFAEKDPQIPPEAVRRIREAFSGRAAAEIAIYVYPGAAPGFDRPTKPTYDKQAAGLAHSRSIALLRRAMGPHYDLEALWEMHTTCEFATRDVAATMRTMVAEPYVNHVPVMTGGVGQRDLARFYANHFIPKLPPDTRLVPISRTVGADRIVDEMLFCFTHDTEIDFMLPGVPPTGKYVEVPTVAIVNFRGDKICHEHIYWDQASVLVQIGLLDPANLPVAGIDTAKKLLDETCPSNTLMKRWAESTPEGS